MGKIAAVNLIDAGQTLWKFKAQQENKKI